MKQWVRRVKHNRIAKVNALSHAPWALPLYSRYQLSNKLRVCL